MREPMSFIDQVVRSIPASSTPRPFPMIPLIPPPTIPSSNSTLPVPAATRLPGLVLSLSPARPPTIDARSGPPLGDMGDIGDMGRPRSFTSPLSRSVGWSRLVTGEYLELVL